MGCAFLKIKFAIALLLLVPFITLKGQNSLMHVKGVDIEYLFKVSILLDNCEPSKEDDFPIKDGRLFEAFNKSHTLLLDTLEISRTKGFSNSFKFDSFKFYKVDIADGIIYNNKSLKIAGPSFGWERVYVICVNHKTGSIYRLSGFNGNDFKNLLIDLNEKYIESNKKSFTIKSFIRTFHVESLDFKCLYRGLKANYRNWTKYPCLKRCIDPMYVN